MKTLTDSFKINDKISEGPAGSIICQARLTRVGVFDYGFYKQLRDESEVFNPESLETLHDIPLTLEHPDSTLVNPDNYKEQTIGHVINGTVKRVGDYVQADVMISDAQAIELVKSKKMLELSCGYTVDDLDESGVYDGIDYDSVQTNIKYNHLSLVPEGRAGPQCRLIVDAKHKDKIMAENEKLETEVKPSEVSEEVKADAKPETDAKEAPEVQEVDFEAKALELQAKLDAAKTEFDTKIAEAKADAGKVSDAQIAKLVKDKLALIDTVKTIVSDVDEEVLIDMPELEAKISTIKEKFPEMDLEGKSEDYVNGVFETLVFVAKAEEETEEVSEEPAMDEEKEEEMEEEKEDVCEEKEDESEEPEEEKKTDSVSKTRSFRKVTADDAAKVAVSSNKRSIDEYQEQMKKVAFEPTSTGIVKSK